MAIHEEFGCKGFYGFGAGVELQRLIGPDDHPGTHPVTKRGVYCGRQNDGCPISQECWDAHRARVNELLPGIAEFIGKLEEKGLKGPELAKMVFDELGTEPYSAVMAGNLEDGSLVSAGMHPKDRGEMTIPYPFKEKN